MKILLTDLPEACEAFRKAIDSREKPVVTITPHESHANTHVISATLGGVHAGELTLGPNRHDSSKFSSSHLFVQPEHRRKGVATAMYDAAHKAGIKPIVPDHDKLSPDGRALWDSKRTVKMGQKPTELQWTPKKLVKAFRTGFATALLKGSEPPVAKRMHVNNLLISIENPKGSVRSKGDWQRKMFADYGRIVGAHGPKDKDQVDVFVGPDHEPKNAYIVSQLDKSGAFDEFKIVCGVDSKDEAKALYLKHYPAGWKVGHIEEKPWDKFLVWLKDGQQSGESCPHCGAVHEQGDDGKCNHCRKPWGKAKNYSVRGNGRSRQNLVAPTMRQGQHVRAGASHQLYNLNRSLMPENPLLEKGVIMSVAGAASCPSCGAQGSSEGGKCPGCGADWAEGGEGMQKSIRLMGGFGLLTVLAMRDELQKAIDKRDKGTAVMDFEPPEHKPVQPEMFAGEVPKSPHFSPTQAQLNSARKDRHPAIHEYISGIKSPHEQAYATNLHAWHAQGSPGMSPLYEGRDEKAGKAIKSKVASLVEEHGAKKPVEEKPVNTDADATAAKWYGAPGTALANAWKEHKPDIELSKPLAIADAAHKVSGEDRRQIAHLAEGMQYASSGGISKHLHKLADDRDRSHSDAKAIQYKHADEEHEMNKRADRPLVDRILQLNEHMDKPEQIDPHSLRHYPDLAEKHAPH